MLRNYAPAAQIEGSQWQARSATERAASGTQAS